MKRQHLFVFSLLLAVLALVFGVKPTHSSTIMVNTTNYSGAGSFLKRSFWLLLRPRRSSRGISLIVLFAALALLASAAAPSASAQMTGADPSPSASRANLPRALVEQAHLVAADGTADDQFGYAIASSDNGNLAVIGAPYKSGGGAAYIFARIAGAWSQAQKLTGGTQAVNFGFSVAMSGDGNTVAIGDPAFPFDDTRAQGAVFVFTRAGGIWTTQQVLRVLRVAGKFVYISFGDSVALSRDGSTLVVGANWEQVTFSDQGAAYVFTRSGNNWNQQAKLLASDGGTADHFGSAVTINGDGSRVVVGASQDDLINVNDDRGSAYVFDRPVSGWAGNLNENAKLIASDGEDSGWFGASVSISDDGNRVALGAPGHHNGTIYEQGAAYSFVRSGGVWSQEQKLLASDRGAENADFGGRVSISADGNALAVGAPYDSSDDVICGGVMCQWHGSAYVFARKSGTWVEQQKLMASDKGFDDQAGVVAISGNGATIFFGAAKHDVGSNSNQGSAYVFTSYSLYLPLILR